MKIPSVQSVPKTLFSTTNFGASFRPTPPTPIQPHFKSSAPQGVPIATGFLPLIQPATPRLFLPREIQIFADSLSRLRQDSLVDYSTAMARAKAIHEDPERTLSHVVTGMPILPPVTTPITLMSSHRDELGAEARTYLLSHLMALESAVVDPKHRLQITPDMPMAVQAGITDADAVVLRRVQQLNDKDENLRLNNAYYDLHHATAHATLHEHLGGCVPMAMVRANFIAQGKPEEGYLPNKALQLLCRVPRGAERTLETYRSQYDLVSRAINSNETAYLSAYMYTLKSALENTHYFEVSFNPINRFITNPMQYIQSVQGGIDDAANFIHQHTGKTILGNLTLAADRQPKLNEHDLKSKPRQDITQGCVNHAMTVLEIAFQARQAGYRVTSFGLQGDEEGFSILSYRPVAQRLHAYNLACWQAMQAHPGTPDKRIAAKIHAGETPYSGTFSHPNRILRNGGSVYYALRLFLQPNPDAPSYKINPHQDPNIKNITPLQLEHAIYMGRPGTLLHKKILQLIRENRVGVDQCPKSNNQTGAVKHYSKSRTLYLLHQGILVSAACDNRTLSKTNRVNEDVKLSIHCNAVQTDREALSLNAVRTAAIFDPVLKMQLLAEMEAQNASVRRKYATLLVQEQDAQGRQALIHHV